MDIILLPKTNNNKILKENNVKLKLLYCVVSKCSKIIDIGHIIKDFPSPHLTIPINFLFDDQTRLLLIPVSQISLSPII